MTFRRRGFRGISSIDRMTSDRQRQIVVETINRTKIELFRKHQKNLGVENVKLMNIYYVTSWARRPRRFVLYNPDKFIRFFSPERR